MYYIYIESSFFCKFVSKLSQISNHVKHEEKGVRFGRPKISTPSNTNEILDQYINHEITNIKAAKLIAVSRGTFFRLVRERKQQIKSDI